MIPSFYPAFVYGGPIRSVYSLCQQLVLQNCRVRVLTTDANGWNQRLEVETHREIELGKDFSYLQYRLERFLMYHDMLELTVRSIVRHANLAQVQADIDNSMKQQLQTYEDLWLAVASMPEPV